MTYQVVCLRTRSAPGDRRRPVVESHYHFGGDYVDHAKALSVLRSCEHAHDFRVPRRKKGSAR